MEMYKVPRWGAPARACVPPADPFLLLPLSPKAGGGAPGSEATRGHRSGPRRRSPRCPAIPHTRGGHRRARRLVHNEPCLTGHVSSPRVPQDARHLTGRGLVKGGPSGGGVLEVQLPDEGRPDQRLHHPMARRLQAGHRQSKRRAGRVRLRRGAVQPGRGAVQPGRRAPRGVAARDRGLPPVGSQLHELVAERSPRQGAP
mmetsp:Transcript_92971/g.268494  ORF Transcript_92971/g.268494 Transcript_92971/m.268494 type:complete len:200 (-) Transcript_92971:611-1210(-)